ncbi:MAG: phosphatase PAP2 family protein [Acidothermus sp.]|nr:phosphatase PAP2 family protein [Acidothermus sp.]
MAQRADQAGSRESAPSVASAPSATVSRRSIRPPSWQAGLRQIGLGLAIFAVYLAVTHLVPKDRVVADAHGRDLLRLEERFGIAWEHGLNDFLAGHPLLGLLASWEYATTYVVVTFGVLLWVWRRRPDVYPWARNTLAGSTLAAIVCFAVWPTSPPRLLPGESFTDVVALNHPPGSWGTDVVSAGADQFAAMPSLHVGWAAWVLAVIARLHVSRLALALGSLHFAITTVDVLATGTHYVADAMAGALLILAAVGAEAVRAAWLGPSAPPRRPLHRAPAVARWYPVAAEDAFFLHIESAVAPQLVGGLAILAGRPDVDAMRAAVAAKLPVLPRLRQVVRSGGLRRRPRWLDVDHVDLSWHIPEIHLPAGGGWEALRRIVSEILAAPLDRSRPLWRLLLVPDVAPGRSALIVLFHHAVGDGLGVLSIVRELLEPVAPFAADDAASGPGRVETPARRRYRLPGPFSRAALTAVGLAQLATDGVGTKLPGFEALSGRRELVGFSLPLDAVRKAARENGCRVTDLVVAAVGDAVACALAAVGIPGQGRRTRAAVPITLRPPAEPGVWDGMPGNRTAALMVDVPLDPIPVGERLRAISADAERRRRSGRPLASAAVVRSIGLLPARWHEWLARLIYRPPHFGLIVTNIPGPDIPLAFVGVPVVAVYPLVSLAEDVPLAVGALGWNGRLCVAATLDSAWAVDTALLLNRLREAFSALGVDTDADGGTLW